MTIIIENNENIRTIILNRPKKLNSVNLKMATELNQAVKNAASDKSVQCLVITGNGRAFSSGGDVNEMGEHLPKAGDLFYDLTEQIHSIFSTILRMEKPVINSLNGVVAGGSSGFAMLIEICTMSILLLQRQRYTIWLDDQCLSSFSSLFLALVPFNSLPF